MTTVYKAEDPALPFRAAQSAKVSVNGVSIPAAAISREVQHHTAATPLQAWKEATRSLALRELILQEARRLEIEPEPETDEEGRRETDDEALIRQLIEREVKTPTADTESCRRYYECNRARFRSPDIFEAAHILIAAHQNDVEAFVAARTLADQLIEILSVRPELFGQFAETYSTCTSAKTGGNLGQISRGDTTPGFEAALFKLVPGEMTREPVATPYGLHIIRLDRRIEGGVLPFEMGEKRIAAYLSERSRRQATAQYLACLAATAELEGVDFLTPTDVRVY